MSCACSTPSRRAPDGDTALQKVMGFSKRVCVIKGNGFGNLARKGALETAWMVRCSRLSQSTQAPS